MKKIYLFIMLFSLYLFNGYGQMSSDTRKSIGSGMVVGGVAISTAMILESQSSYGTYSQVNPKSYNSTYVTPPFYKQFPKNVFFVVGVGFTITGLFNLKK